MKIQVLVNHYKEDNSIVSRFLSSLEMQKNIEFEVLLYTDGGNELDLDFLNQFNLSIIYKYLSHSGICHTRNQLLDDSTADYIVFCDIDDCFSSSDGLYTLLHTIKENNLDIVGSPYQSEGKQDGVYTYVTVKEDKIRLHGKIFRRQYLIDNNIRFPDELESSGDMMFLWLAYSLTNKFTWTTENFYIWKYNSQSITRYDTYAPIYQFPRTIKCYTLLAYDLINRYKKELFDTLIPLTTSMIFLESTSKLWDTAPQEVKREANFAIRNFLIEFYDYYIQLPLSFRQSAFVVTRNAKARYKTSKDFSFIDEWAQEKLQIEDEQEIVIIGCGVVGTNLKKELDFLNPEIYDKYKKIDTRTAQKYKVAFICVDTPRTEENKCDISEVKNAILSQEANIYVVKSTVLPGTIEQLTKELKKHIVFSPEYYGETQHCNNYDFNFTILGGEKEDCYKVVQTLQKVYDGRHQFRITDSKTAELVKYMENSYLATKVSFCQQFYRIAEKLEIPYEELRELFVLDPRINPSHTFVYEETPYWSSHCLDKDVKAIAEEYDADFLQSVIDYNELCKINK